MIKSLFFYFPPIVMPSYVAVTELNCKNELQGIALKEEDKKDFCCTCHSPLQIDINTETIIRQLYN